MLCKYCQSSKLVKYGVRKGIQYYLCRDCGHKSSGTDSLIGMRTPKIIIGAALGLFYDGLSVESIARQIHNIFAEDVDPATVYRWIIKYSSLAHSFLDQLDAGLSAVWVVDETVIKINGVAMWYWDVIDEGTRFLVDTRLSRTRSTADVVALFSECRRRTSIAPRVIISDKLASYVDGIERVFGASSQHIQSQGFTSDVNINLIERFHGTLKQRTKVLRGLKTVPSAKVVLDGFVVHYNFFKPHMSLRDSTPAQAARIGVPFQNWQGLLEYWGGKGLSA